MVGRVYQILNLLVCNRTLEKQQQQELVVVLCAPVWAVAPLV